MHEKIISFFGEIEEMVIQNHDLMEILCGFCEHISEDSYYGSALLTAMKIIKENQYKIIEKIDSDTTKLGCEILVKKP